MNAEPGSGCGGLTLVEALIVVAVLAVLVAMILPSMGRARPRSARVNCVNHLKQIGLAFRQWSLDNTDKYPMQVSVTNGGAMEWVRQGIAWPAFQVMSNELNSRKLLICPTDTSRTNAPSFDRNLQNWELSYFVGVDADETRPQMFLSGDSNLEIGGGLVQSGLVTLSTNRLVSWSARRHQRQGNVGLADGSVQGYSTTRLREALTNTGDLTNRIIIP
jgi:prepilin-type processing-associated H-X9-DG protein